MGDPNNCLSSCHPIDEKSSCWCMLLCWTQVRRRPGCACITTSLPLVAPHPAIQPLPESQPTSTFPVRYPPAPPALPPACAASSSDHTSTQRTAAPPSPLPAWKKHSRNTREVPSAGETRNSLQRSQHFPGCRIHFASIGPFVSAALALALFPLPFLLPILHLILILI
jgi:hypothetical protein